MIDQQKNEVHLKLTSNILSAYVSHNPVPVSGLSNLIGNIHKSLTALAAGETKKIPAETLKPAVSIKKSLQDDYIVCLEDGRKFKSMKGHLASHHGLTPEEYRGKWGLPTDYPMAAPAYSIARSALAKKMGLGRKPKAQPEPVAAPAKRGRNPKAA